jgi:hypothetical protein
MSASSPEVTFKQFIANELWIQPVDAIRPLNLCTGVLYSSVFLALPYIRTICSLCEVKELDRNMVANDLTDN